MSTRGTEGYQPDSWHLFHDLLDKAKDGHMPLYLEVWGQPAELLALGGPPRIEVRLPPDLAAIVRAGLAARKAATGKVTPC